MKRNHRLRGNYKRKAVPIALHGDGVATTAVGKSCSESVEGFSWQSCLMMGRGGVTLTNFLICMIFKNALEGSPETQAEIWLWMCWSLYWAYQGTHPTHRPDGSEYTTGIEADLACTELAGVFFWCCGRFAGIWNIGCFNWNCGATIQTLLAIVAMPIARRIHGRMPAKVQHGWEPFGPRIHSRGISRTAIAYLNCLA